MTLQFTHRHTVEMPKHLVELFHYYSLHPTKGWRRERVSRSQALYMRTKSRVPILGKMPFKMSLK